MIYNFNLYDILTSKERIHGSEMANSIHHIVKNINHMRPNFISSESVKNIACVLRLL